MDAVQTEIREFILAQFPVAKKKKIKVDDVLLESGIIDSLGVMEIVSYIAEQFQIDIEEDDLVPENFNSVRAIAHFVNIKRNGNGSKPA
jgi:acyl carrier protein